MKVPALSALALSLCSIAAAPARAQEPAPAAATPQLPAAGALGSPGQIVISTDVPLGLTQPMVSLLYSSVSLNGGSTTSYGIAPSFDYFVAAGLSVGGLLGVGYTQSASDPSAPIGPVPSSSRTVIQAGARVGYDLALNDSLSLWPRVGVTYTHIGLSGGGAPDASAHKMNLIFFAPVLWHPAHHFFVGAGPVMTTDLVNKFEGTDTGKTTAIGIAGLLGGYF